MSKIIEFFANRKLLVNLLTIVIAFAGIFSVTRLKQDFMPQADLHYMAISVLYPGAAAHDVEVNAVIPIERKLKSISGIDEYTSTSMENIGIILVALDSELKNPSEVKDTVIREVNSVSGLPDEIEDISIVNINPNVMPVMELGVSLTKESALTEQDLMLYIDQLEKDLLSIKGVGELNTEGYREEEIHINVLPGKMEKNYISLNDIVNSIRTRNIRANGGTLQSTGEDRNIVTIGQFDDPMEVKNVIIRSNYEREMIRVSDIANVEKTFEKQIIKVNVNAGPGVIVQIKKSENSDVVRTVQAVKKFVASYPVPDGINISVTHDRSMAVSSMIKIVLTNAIIGFIFVFLVLLVFLFNFRFSFWTAFAIPTIMFLAFIFMYFNGLTLNLLSLAAMAMLLGILVDEGIVISESIIKYKDKGFAPVEAVKHGVKDVAGPIIVSGLTTIFAFLPMFMIKGMMGKFIAIFPLMVIVILVASLFEALFILPSHLSHDRHSTKKPGPRMQKLKGWFNPISAGYKVFLEKALRFRYLILLGFMGVFALTIVVSLDTIKNFVLMDDDASDTMQITLEAPEGTSLQNTWSLVKNIEEVLSESIDREEIVSIKSVTGHHGKTARDSGVLHENWALVTVNLTPEADRAHNTDELIAIVMNAIPEELKMNFTKLLIEKDKFGPPTGSPVNIQISGTPGADVPGAVQAIKSHLEQRPYLYNITDDEQEKAKELVINFDYEKMAMYNLNVQTVAQAVRTAYEGTVATSIQQSEYELDFRVQIDESFQRDEDFLGSLLIPNKTGKLIRLSEISWFTLQSSDFTIKHTNGTRVITITSDIVKDEGTASQVTRDTMRYFKSIQYRFPGVFAEVGGEAAETRDSFSDLGVAFLVALLLIYFVLIILFNNFTQPFLIMLTIPFGIIGALIAFTLHGMPLSFFGVIGIIGLSGVVVNDCIVMVDFINKSWKNNNGSKNMLKIIAEGAKERLRPVILTTLTTVIGLLPTAYGIGGSSPMIRPVAIALCYGLLFATTLTLIFIPVIYTIRQDIARGLNRLLGKESA
jgi:multidrug efflux pump subunit AcrB